MERQIGSNQEWKPRMKDMPLESFEKRSLSVRQILEHQAYYKAFENPAFFV